MHDYLKEKGVKGIGERMKAIAEIFQSARYFAEQNFSNEAVANYLMQQHEVYRAVAFEGASMSIAARDMGRSGELKDWQSFVRDHSGNYMPHAYVGLGWAIARSKSGGEFTFSEFDQTMIWRIFEGWGYHNRIFKKRNNELPEYLPRAFESAYYQGQGRAIWYEAKGRLNDLDIILKFLEAARLPATWIGIGIASTFVGGLLKSELDSLAVSSGSCLACFKTGIAMTCRARSQSGVVTSDLMEASKTMLGISPFEVSQITIDAEPQKWLNGASFYKNWIENLLEKTR